MHTNSIRNLFFFYHDNVQDAEESQKGKYSALSSVFYDIFIQVNSSHSLFEVTHKVLEPIHWMI